MARILIIDDEAVVRSYMRSLLEREGHDVIEAGDGNVGLEQFRHAPADLVVVDLIMPGKDGFATIAELRELNPDLPILVTTGAPPARWPIDVLYGQPAEMHILAKPLTEEMLLDTTREALAAVSS